MLLKRTWIFGLMAGLGLLALTACQAQGQQDPELEIHVVDSSGAAIPYATIWMLRDKGVDKALMDRMLKRYQDDADFISSARHPLDGLEVYRTDGRGIARIRMRPEGYGYELGPLVEVAAIKRGYRRSNLERPTAGVGSEPVVISLDGKGGPADPDLLKLDELRAPLYVDGFPEYADDAMVRAAEASMSGLTRLAESLERRRRNDISAIVRFELADAPSATSNGYGRGFDEMSKVDVANMDYAISFSRGSVYLEYLEIDRSLHRLHTSIDRAPTPEEIRAIASSLESYIARNPERTWPIAYHRLWLLHDQAGDLDAACRTLDRLQDYEPNYLSKEEWADYRAHTGEGRGCQRGE